MSDTAIAAIITAFFTALPLLLGQWFAHLAAMKKIEEGRLAQKAEIDKQSALLADVKKATDGITTKLVEAAGETGRAQGVIDEKTRADREEAIRAQGRAEATAKHPIVASNGDHLASGASLGSTIKVEGELTHGSVDVQKTE